MRKLQELAFEKAIKLDTDESLFCQLVRTYGEMRDRIRIEKGLIRPGSRNESVRVEPKIAKRGRPSRTSTLAGAAQALGIVSGPAIDVETVKPVGSDTYPPPTRRQQGV
jgi:hypothetical protein